MTNNATYFNRSTAEMLCAFTRVDHQVRISAGDTGWNIVLGSGVT